MRPFQNTELTDQEAENPKAIVIRPSSRVWNLLKTESDIRKQNKLKNSNVPQIVCEALEKIVDAAERNSD